MYFDEILDHTDLILLDFKGVDASSFERMTKVRESSSPLFLEKAQAKEIKLWIRYVIVPGENDTLEHMDKLAEKVRKLNYVEKVELLPYHTLGDVKYDKLGIENPLKDVDGMDKDYCKFLQDYLNQQLGWQ
jgi:pyruvate formate lyase activating enzyme